MHTKKNTKDQATVKYSNTYAEQHSRQEDTSSTSLALALALALRGQGRRYHHDPRQGYSC